MVSSFPHLSQDIQEFNRRIKLTAYFNKNETRINESNDIPEENQFNIKICQEVPRNPKQTQSHTLQIERKSPPHTFHLHIQQKSPQYQINIA